MINKEFYFKNTKNYIINKKGGLLGNGVLPNDQLELDRLRVLSFIIRWVFEGFVIKKRLTLFVISK